MDRLTLALPGVRVGIEDPISQDVEDLQELGALWVVDEVGVENVVDVSRIDGDENVHAGEPGSLEQEGNMPRRGQFLGTRLRRIPLYKFEAKATGSG
ncbi:unnamed protein product [Spirodela intermedia]|uniref:Uncharacterized protein n=2 Tax=Spirodela intermedia TaxID=51605 RepID=A0A7I8KYY9_SPIIN|nr:unnamed protein product [Spirodela intermedia]CAA6666238.1 unnamed protein product [Spirodela intermedia]CAA7403013.1 unnamed protein product [Spirodela intermedia]